MKQPKRMDRSKTTVRERVDRSTKIVLPPKTGKKCDLPADSGRAFNHDIVRGTYK